MASKWILREYHGTNLNSSSYVVSEVGFKNQDTSGAYGSFPIAIPDDAGTFNYSYEMVVALVCTVAPDVSCSNFKIWCDGAETGVRFMQGSSNNGTTPSQNLSTKATSNIIDHLGIANADQWDMDSYSAVTNKTNYLYLQLRTSSDAISGVESGLWHYKYDEA
jgi:hypothetical protein